MAFDRLCRTRTGVSCWILTWRERWVSWKTWTRLANAPRQDFQVYPRFLLKPVLPWHKGLCNVSSSPPPPAWDEWYLLCSQNSTSSPSPDVKDVIKMNNSASPPHHADSWSSWSESLLPPCLAWSSSGWHTRRQRGGRSRASWRPHPPCRTLEIELRWLQETSGSDLQLLLQGLSRSSLSLLQGLDRLLNHNLVSWVGSCLLFGWWSLFGGGFLWCSCFWHFLCLSEMKRWGRL